MALTNTSALPKGTIITIIDGAFTQRLADNATPEDAPSGTTFRKRALKKGPNAGKEVREARADSLERNIISSASFMTTEYGTNFMLNLIDESEDSFQLQLPVESQFFSQFVKRIPNIDREKTVTFVIGKDTEKDRSFLYLSQEGHSVKMAYTKDNPNGIPQPTQRPNGKWDWSAQEDFLYKKAEEYINELKVDDGSEFEENVPF